jgi:hypothetical protein
MIPYPKINEGGEFVVYDMGNKVLKVPKHERLFGILYGGFARKIASDILFLSTHFSDYFPSTHIQDFPRGWSVVQEKIEGRPLWSHAWKRRKPDIQRFFSISRMCTRARTKDLNYLVCTMVCMIGKNPETFLSITKPEK